VHEAIDPVPTKVMKPMNKVHPRRVAEFQ